MTKKLFCKIPRKKEKLNQIFDKKKLICKIPKKQEIETTFGRQQETILQDN